MKNFILNGVTFLIVAVVSIGFGSCSNDDDENNKNLTATYIYNHLEGRYVGTFDDLYDKSDSRYSGFVEISEIPNQGGTRRKYKIVGIGGEDIAIAGEYWLTDYYHPEGDVNREGQIRFYDDDFWEQKEKSVLYWHLESGFMNLSDLQMTLTFNRYVMGKHNYYEPRWYYRFFGKKEYW